MGKENVIHTDKENKKRRKSSSCDKMDGPESIVLPELSQRKTRKKQTAKTNPSPTPKTKQNPQAPSLTDTENRLLVARVRDGWNG